MSHNRSKNQPVNFFKLLQTIHIPRHDIPVRPNPTKSHHNPKPTPQDLAITEPSNPTESDSHDLTNAIHRFRGLANGDYSKDFDEESGRSRLYPENLQTDCDEIFDNFDKCYQASYPKAPQDTNPQPRPVCRELLQELVTEPSSKKSGKTPQPSKKLTPKQTNNVKHIQPKEFPTLKTGQYFSSKPALASSSTEDSTKPDHNNDDVPTVRANNNSGKQLERYYTSGVRFLSKQVKLKVVNKTLEESKFSDDKENVVSNKESEESKSKNQQQKSFMFVQSSAFSMIDTNYKVVQETLKKIRTHDTAGKDTSKDPKAILTDITNDERPTRRGFLRENGELRPLSSGAGGRRKNPVKEIMEHKREDPERVSYNSLMGKINIPEMLGGYRQQAKENLCPAGAKPINVAAKLQEVQRESIRAAEKMVGNRRNSVGGIGRGAQESKLKKIVTGNGVLGEKKNTRHERNQTEVGISKEDITRYFALAKKNIKNISNGNKNNVSRRSLSGTRW